MAATGSLRLNFSWKEFWAATLACATVGASIVNALEFGGWWEFGYRRKLMSEMMWRLLDGIVDFNLHG